MCRLSLSLSLCFCSTEELRAFSVWFRSRFSVKPSDAKNNTDDKYDGKHAEPPSNAITIPTQLSPHRVQFLTQHGSSVGGGVAQPCDLVKAAASLRQSLSRVTPRVAVQLSRWHIEKSTIHTITHKHNRFKEMVQQSMN